MLKNPNDARFMAMAIALSQRGRGRTASNPNVGCVVVKGGHVVGRGWTQPGGRPHAEAMALAEASKSSHDALVYVTLEPCAHESKRGPACVESLIEANPARVVIASLDPDERTHRKGIDQLGEAGISVSIGLMETEAQQAMAGFFARMEMGRPHITLKLAMSLDGCIAMADGESQWITGPRARAHTHLERARSDAILVGSGTVKADQPKLDVRLEGLEDRNPLPIVLGKAETPDHWQRISTPGAVSDLENVNWLLVEGGAATAASFLQEGLVDRLMIYRAPIVIGGGLPSVREFGLAGLDEAHGRWDLVDRRILGKDSLEIYDRAA